MEGQCDTCGTSIEIHMCCGGYECGCMGMPTEPPVCAKAACWDVYFKKLGK